VASRIQAWGPEFSTPFYDTGDGGEHEVRSESHAMLILRGSRDEAAPRTPKKVAVSALAKGLADGTNTSGAKEGRPTVTKGTAEETGFFDVIVLCSLP